METNKPKILSLSHDFKEKYIFACFSDSSIGIYENVSNFKKALYFIDKINFFNPVNKIVNSYQKDNLMIGCKLNCVAFCNPQSMKTKFILHVENTELNGFILDSKKRIFWTYGNDKLLRGWEISENLFGNEGKRRILNEWHKDTIMDTLDLKTMNHYVSKKSHPVEPDNFDDLKNKRFDDSDSEPEEISEVKDPIPQERSFKEDIKNIIPSFSKSQNKNVSPQKSIEYDSEDENSAAKKYGLVKISKLENLNVSNSENDSENEDNHHQQVKQKKREKKNISNQNNLQKKEKKEEKVESETESDDDLTGWF
jgi:hypothetical protein